MLRGMEDSVLGIWCAHGEGQAVFKSDYYYEQVVTRGLAPIRFVNEQGIPTQDYPFNPNGSRDGIAGKYLSFQLVYIYIHFMNICMCVSLLL